MRSIGSRSWSDRLSGLAELPVPPHVFRLERGALAYAGFNRGLAGLELREARSVELPPGTFGDGPLGAPPADAVAFAAAVDRLASALAHRPRHASLVLPDAWARALAVELGDLPSRGELRRDVLRFRLKKLVPFRVDELRIEAAPIPKLERQEEVERALVLFASESLCAALEHAFAAAGIALGQIVNASLARLEALAWRGRLPGLAALAAVDTDGFTIIFARDGEPVVWRQKSFTEGLDDADRRPMLESELRLTRTFLTERVGGDPLQAVVLAAPADVRGFWLEVLEEGLERPVTSLEPALLPLADGAAAGRLGDDPAPIVGAACREVA